MRWVKRILVGLAALAVLLIALVFFLLGTAAGGKLALDAIVFPRLPIEVQVADLSGRLWGDFELTDAEVRLPGVEARADRLAVRFRPWALLGKHVELGRVELEGVTVRVFEAPSPDSLTQTPDSARVSGPADTVPPLMNLPVRITFDTVLAEGLAGTIMDSIAVTSGRMRLTGSLERFSLAFEGTASEPTIGDVSVAVEGEASPGRMQVASLRVGMLDGTIDGSGEVAWWPDIVWRLDFAGNELRPGGLMEDPAEWPGTLSLAASTSGKMDPETGLTLEATIDTIAGDVRGESLSGRLAGSLSNGILDLAASSIVWGPARVRASGSYADAADLDFEASVPNLGLVLPGSVGSVEASGRVSGDAKGPRVVADFRARNVDIDSGRLTLAEATGNVDVDIAAGPRVVADFEARKIEAEDGRFVAAEADGRVDLDLSAQGTLSGDAVARSLELEGKALDSVTLGLSGSRPDHQLTIDAVGPAASLSFEANGGLGRDDTWRGTIASLEVAEDSILGVWTLADSVAVTLSPDSIRLDEVCLFSDPARLCVAGTYDASGADFTAEARGLDLVRARPFLPEDLAIDAVLEAKADLAFPTQGPIVGRVEASTTAGELSLIQDDELRRLYFAPATFVVVATADSLAGSVDVAAADSAGTPLIVLDGELSAPAIEELGALLERSASARFELRVADVSLLPFLELGRWDADGSIVATGAFDVDEDRNVSGRLEVDAAPIVLTRAIRRGQRRLTFEPARFDLTIDETGTRAALDVEVANATQPRILVAKATATLPGLRRIDADLEAQPVEGHVELTTADLSVAEGVGEMITAADGSFDLNADLAGTLGELSLVGEARVMDGRLVLPDLGLDLTGIQLTATGSSDGSVTVDGEVTSGGGRVVIAGSSATGPSPETPTRIGVRGERFQIMNRPEIELLADPDLELVFDGALTMVTGEIRIPRGRFQFDEIPEGAVTRSSDVIIVTDTVVPPKPKAPVGLDVQLTLGDDIFFRGFGLTARLGGALRITQDPGGDVRGLGEITMIDGAFRQFGQDLRVEPGRLVFSGPLDSPTVDVRAFVQARDGTEAGLQIGGTPQQLSMETYSRPQKSESETMSYILFGRGLAEASGGEGNQANNAAAVLGANVLTMSLAPSVGLDEARIETGSTRDRSQFVLGKYLTPKLYVGYGVGIYQPISTFRIRYLLSSKWSIESMTGDEKATDLLYRFEVGRLKSSKDKSGDSESGGSASGQSVSGGGG